MNGILVVDKPAEFTSFDVVAKLRGVLHEKRIGHGGTLDPMATGVLPLYIGAATKAVDLNPDTEKRYEGKIRFGLKTDTGDIWGRTLETSDLMPGEGELKSAAKGFIGASKQLPPMYSAIKINGQKLVDIARRGGTVERTPRDIEITEFELFDFCGDEVSFSVCCSKGTYIRTLAEELAQKLGSLASLSALRRTKSGGFTLSDAHELSEIIKAVEDGRTDELLLPVERAFMRYDETLLEAEYEKPFFNGVEFNTALENGIYRISCGGTFALAMVKKGKMKKLKSF